jgi:SseB protein N-terminal domain
MICVTVAGARRTGGIVPGMAAAHPPDPPSYQPANETEGRLAAARGNAAAYLAILRSAMLYVPMLEDAERGTQSPPTWSHDGVPHLAVFTSLGAMALRVAGVADSYRVTTGDELVAQVPEPTSRIAVDPGTPIGAYFPLSALRDLAAGRPELVEFDPAWRFQPANAAERLMYLARNGGRSEAFLDGLVLSQVFLPISGPASAEELGSPRFPWLADLRGPVPVINAFTSVDRLTAAGYAAEQAVCLDFMALVQAWPGPGFALALNAGSAIATLFPGDEVPRLNDWAQELVRRRLGPRP